MPLPFAFTCPFIVRRTGRAAAAYPFETFLPFLLEHLCFGTTCTFAGIWALPCFFFYKTCRHAVVLFSHAVELSSCLSLEEEKKNMVVVVLVLVLSLFSSPLFLTNNMFPTHTPTCHHYSPNPNYSIIPTIRPLIPTINGEERMHGNSCLLGGDLEEEEEGGGDGMRGKW